MKQWHFVWLFLSAKISTHPRPIEARNYGMLIGVALLSLRLGSNGWFHVGSQAHFMKVICEYCLPEISNGGFHMLRYGL